jgi:ClpP class serine protease
VFDLADRIYAARGKKPIWAVANEDAFSAAYAIAAATERLYVSRTAGVGSVGVIAVHLDQSQAEAEAGLAYTAIYAGARKNDLSPHAPLSDPARLLLQQEVDRVYGLFVNTVARMRRLSPEAVVATEAGIYMSEQAIAAGLADRNGTLETALADLRTALGRSKNHTAVIHQAVSHAINQGGKRMDALETITEADDPAAPPVAKDTALVADPTLQGQQAPAAVMEAAMAYVAEVTELCQLAGFADRATDLIKRQVPVESVRKALLEARASVAEASAIIGQPPVPETKPGKVKIDTAAIYARRNRTAHNQKENDECLS